MSASSISVLPDRKGISKSGLNRQTGRPNRTLYNKLGGKNGRYLRHGQLYEKQQKKNNRRGENSILLLFCSRRPLFFHFQMKNFYKRLRPVTMTWRIERTGPSKASNTRCCCIFTVVECQTSMSTERGFHFQKDRPPHWPCNRSAGEKEIFFTPTIGVSIFFCLRLDRHSIEFYDRYSFLLSVLATLTIK